MFTLQIIISVLVLVSQDGVVNDCVLLGHEVASIVIGSRHVDETMLLYLQESTGPK